MKDWRGTEIEVGSKIIYHGESSWAVGIGTVTRVEEHSRWLGYVWANWKEHKSTDNRNSRPLLQENVTVLTKDMLEMIIR